MLMKLISRILKTLGAKATAWNQEFKTDAWDQETKGDPIYPVLQRYPGSVLEIGCGSGRTPAEMAFTTYTGVDFAKEAIAKAMARNPQHQFQVADMDGYLPTRKYDVILFRESIYYARSVPALLKRLEPYLEPGGVFIARICNRIRHRDVIEEIRANRKIKIVITLETEGVILVFA
jgi:SAM-dependent methyltransferase